MRKFCAAVALCSIAVLAASQAFAATNSIPYADLVGTNVTFGGSPSYVSIANPNGWMQETNGDGSPTALFDAPTVSGNSLLFSPSNYVAQASGAGGNDSALGLFQTVITATPLFTIDQLNLTEFGDATLLGAASSGTGVFASLAGFVRVLEVNGLPITPLTIGFNAGGLQNGSFTPGTLGTTGLDRNTNGGTTLWSGQLSVDIAAALALAGISGNATKVELALDNDLYAYSEFASNSAKIQKKAVTGPTIIIDVIPEPGTAALLCVGLVAMTLRARGRRA
ncbi:MAG TPA: PEP-CTERM sorting domain-containing protein [Myxococcota bacterium]|nr:PEP-CTERM sorting domain-containing protein [Myxococcota bacterium]